jgi:uncharacterized protein (DUF433 family)
VSRLLEQHAEQLFGSLSSFAAQRGALLPRLGIARLAEFSTLNLRPTRVNNFEGSLHGTDPSRAYNPSSDCMEFSRITIDPKRMAGVPCIRNLRIPVATVIDMIADGMSEAEILQAYPDLESADIKEALRFAAEAVRERELPLLSDR